MNKIKTLFIGTSDFAIPILQRLIESETFEVIGLVTQPDKPVGRKQELTMPPVKKYLDSASIKIETAQPEKIRKVPQEILGQFNPELIIVASYGQIIPKEILNYPKYKALNFHVSLLPDLRGAVPMPMAILKGYKKTGVTLQIMAEALDEGDVLASREIEIEDSMTTEDLINTAAQVSAEMVDDELIKWVEGKITPVKQDNAKATYCYMSDLVREKAEIKFETDVNLAERMVRAFYPWPIAWVKLQMKNAMPTARQEKLKIKRRNLDEIEGEVKLLKIYRAKPLLSSGHPLLEGEEKRSGAHLRREGKSLILDLQNGSLELLEVQLEGRKRDDAKNYLYLAD